MAGEGTADEVEDRRDERRFVLRRDGAEAELTYRSSPERLVLVHTAVPEALEGRGIGGSLVRAAVERAAAEGLAVVPVCPYARSWLEKHPEVADTVTVDRSER